MVNWLADEFLLSDYARVVYADNNFAPRKRTNQRPSTNEGNLNLPFINFIQKGGEPDNPQQWYHWRLDKPGVYVPEMESIVRAIPITVPYESTFWCASAKEMRYVANKLYFFKENHTDLQVDIDYTFIPEGETEETTVQVPHYVKLNFTGISVDPSYEQNEWLERNISHSISMDFEIHTWGFELGGDISISESTLFRFTSSFDKYTADYWDKEIEIT